MTISSELGGSWYLHRSGNTWKLSQLFRENPTTEIILDPDDAWKLFSKSIRPDDIRNKITVNGNQPLAEVALSMVSVMA